ncbi:MAG TPA: hypothetical protein VEW04_03845, partial [Allosphingosinicella sp.]|nr:hypothetical protein [Allosphingosinicella sp.]
MASTHPAEQPGDPPQETIDFFGRRKLCAEMGPEEHWREGERREARRLACDRLPAEERDIRARYADSPAVIAWLSRDPHDFRLGVVMVSSWDGPPPALVRRVEQTGVAMQSGDPYRLVMEDDGRGETRITASYGDLQPRTFVLDNGPFPQIDLASAIVMLGTRAPRDGLIVRLRYGYIRGYCSLVIEEDDRPKLSIDFGREAIEA